MGARFAFASAFGLAVPWLGREGPPRLPSATGSGTVPGESFQEGYYRVLLDWTPDDLRAAVYMSATGWIMLAADLCTAMRGDDRLPAVLRSRVLAVQGAPLSFEAAMSGRLRRRALKAAQAEEDWWDMLPEAELEELRSWLRLFGVALAELVWTEPDPGDSKGIAVIARLRNGRNVPRLKVWDPRHLRKDMETGRWWVRLRDGTETEARPGDGKWVLMTIGGSRPWMQAPWRGCANLWLDKQYAREDWAQQSERYADGMIGIESPEGSSKEERDRLAEDFNNAGKRPVFVFPDGFTAKILELDAQAWKTYEAKWSRCDRGFAVAIQLGDLGAESGKMQLGASLQGEVRDDVRRADAASDETALRDQVLKPWSAANFGDPELAPWPMYETEAPTDTRAVAMTWNFTAQAIATADKTGIDLDLAAIRDATGLPVTGRKAPTVTAPPPGFGAPDKSADKVPPPDVADAVLAIVADSGDLAAALDDVSRAHGGALTAAERRALSRLPAPRAAGILRTLFAEHAAARERAAVRAATLNAARFEAPPMLERLAA